MIRADRFCAAWLALALLGPLAQGQGIDARKPARGVRRIEAARPANKPLPAPRPARTNVMMMMQIGGTMQQLALLPPEPAEPAEADRPGDFDEEPEPPAAPAFRILVVEDWVIATENFDRILRGGAGRPSEPEHLAKALQARLDRLAREFRLDPEQWAKLRLAGLGDIKHLLDRIDEARAEFEAVRGNLGKANPTLRRVVALGDEYRAGPFGEGSLLAKTLRTIRDAEASKQH